MQNGFSFILLTAGTAACFGGIYYVINKFIFTENCSAESFDNSLLKKHEKEFKKMDEKEFGGFNNPESIKSHLLEIQQNVAKNKTFTMRAAELQISQTFFHLFHF